MERKTKHRILGILVVIGLVIILLPFFQSGKELKSQASLVKAPPFPDQSVQVMTTPAQTETANDEKSIPLSKPQAAESNVNQVPEDTIISVAHPSIVNEQVPVETQQSATVNTSKNVVSVTSEKSIVASDKQAKVTELAPAPASANEEANIQMTNAAANSAKAAKLSEALLDSGIPANQPTHAKTLKVAKTTRTAKKMVQASKHVHGNKIQTASSVQSSFKHNGLAELKNVAWVIQIGSFKNKTNALRLVNQLRANGYRAFIQQKSTTFGENTRVFVGPESKRTSARELADRLESDMHIRGIVISYKPLTL